MAARGRSPRGRFGVLLAALGAVAILGGTFGAGVFVGRYWARVQVVTGLVQPRADDRTSGGTAAHIPARAARPTAETGREVATVPRLTFYEELTAPLEPAGSPSPPPAVTIRAPARDLAPAAARPAERPAVGDFERGRGEFTVQVAAYGSRVPAEALRTALVARGFDAGVSTVHTPAGLRYRVRVGSFGTREAAAAVVARLASEARVGAVVMRADGNGPAGGSVRSSAHGRDRGVATP